MLFTDGEQTDSDSRHAHVPTSSKKNYTTSVFTHICRHLFLSAPLTDESNFRLSHGHGRTRRNVS